MLRSAFVIGASGAVGTQLVEALVSSRQFKKILVVGRRQIPLKHEESVVSSISPPRCLARGDVSTVYMVFALD